MIDFFKQVMFIIICSFNPKGNQICLFVLCISCLLTWWKERHWLWNTLYMVTHLEFLRKGRKRNKKMIAMAMLKHQKNYPIFERICQNKEIFYTNFKKSYPKSKKLQFLNIWVNFFEPMGSLSLLTTTPLPITINSRALKCYFWDLFPKPRPKIRQQLLSRWIKLTQHTSEFRYHHSHVGKLRTRIETPLTRPTIFEFYS